jgi:hypothetical protein
MMVTEPPDLQGTTCTGLVLQEYWYDGAVCESAHVFFLQLDHGLWHRFFIDAGVLFWSTVTEPDVHNTTADEEFHYPQQELGAERGLLGSTLQNVEFVDTPPVYSLRLHFSGGTTLILRNENDHNTLLVERV